MTKKEDESKSPGGHGARDMSSRRARLRTSLNKQSSSSDLRKGELVEAEEKSSMNEVAIEHGANSSLSQAIESMGRSVSNEPMTAQLEAVALLGHIDQVLNACVGHLASLQTMTSKQIEALRVIAETLQSRAFSNEGQALNPLLESLTAAIEPMKAIGELVPALDRLVNATESNDQFNAKSEVSNDKFVIGLAQQLLAGSIDSITFKSACQAIFPNEDTALLTHRLGELLDRQQLSGESFQAAFQALQVDQPNNYLASEESGSINQAITFDEEARKEFLQKEEEFFQILTQKEQEIENIRQQLEGQRGELADQCEELNTALRNREDVLREKETELNKKNNELSAKDSENQQLKAQIAELKDKTKEMMTDLQRQLAKKQEEEISRKQEEGAAKQPQDVSSKATQPAAPSPQSGFFDFVSTGNANNTLFNTSSPSLFPTEPNSIDNGETQIVQNVEEEAEANGWQPVDIRPSGRFGASDYGSQALANNNTTKISVSNNLANDAQANTQASASFVSAVGSYGSGVRAQVFEVIVRQALAGTQWREICAVPMQSNNILPQEVEAEVKRRQALLKK